MSRRDMRTPEERELDARIECANAEQARLDETLTRREVIEAIDWVRDSYSPFHDSAFRELLERLAKALS